MEGKQEAELDAPEPSLPAPRRRLLHQPLVYALFLALYAASFREEILPPGAETGSSPQERAPARASRRSLEDVLRRPHEVPFGAAVAILIPLILGAGLLAGYLILRAHGIVVFPRCGCPEAPWSGWHLARVAIAFLLIARAVAIGVAWLPHLLGRQGVWGAMPPGPVLALAANLAMGLVCLFVVALIGRADGNPLRLLGLHESRPLNRALVGVAGFAMAFPVLFLAGLLMLILGPRMGVPAQPQQILAQAGALSPRAFAVVVFSVVVVTPVTEEVFFRGFFYATLRRSMGPLGAIVLSAFVFALLHAYAFGLLPLFVIGFLLAYLYERTGSIVAPVVAHAANNLHSLLVTYLAVHEALG